MPISRLPNGKLLYFAHVPKCGGTAVERYLSARFGPLGMLDTLFSRRGAAGWSLTPPQHMPEIVRRDLLPDRLFDSLFATVRHPATRLRSVYRFQLGVEKSIPASMSFDRWLELLPRQQALDPSALSGHLRPMVDFVPRTARVFRLEDGLDQIIPWLDDLAGERSGPRAMTVHNAVDSRLGERAPPLPPMSPKAIDMIVEVYARDFDRFGYQAAPPDGDSPGPAS